MYIFHLKYIIMLQLDWDHNNNNNQGMSENVVQPGIEPGSLDYQCLITTQPENPPCCTIPYCGSEFQ